MKTSIRATNIDLTQDIKGYVNEKMDSLDKFFNNIISSKVEIGMNSRHHQKGKIFFCEANVRVPNNLIRVKKTSESLLKAIDKTKDHLRVILKRHKEKIKGRPMKDNAEFQKEVMQNIEDEL